MADAIAERDLLLGMLALGTGRISREALAEALDAGGLDLAPLIEQVEGSWQRHGGNLARILPELGSRELAREVAGLPRDPSTRERMLRTVEKAFGPVDWSVTVDQGASAGSVEAIVTVAEMEADSDPESTVAIGDLTSEPGMETAALEETGAAPGASATPTVAFSSMGSATERFESQEPRGRGGATEAPMEPGMRFRILRRHAKGGLGEVFVAIDEQLNRMVALKEIQARFADRSECQARFRFEGR